MTRLPGDIQRALDTLDPATRKAFRDAIEGITSRAQMQTIIGHIEAGNIDAAIAALRIDPRFFAPLDRALSEAFYQGGVIALAGLPRLKDPFPAGGWCLALMHAIRAQND